MGNKSFRLSPLAEQDLENIWLYTYQEWSNEQADKYVYTIMAVIEKLSSGKLIAMQADIREGYWKYFVASHVLYFVKHKSTNGIDIIRILHKSMDMESHL